MKLREERINSLLKELASEFLSTKAKNNTLLSATDVVISSDLKNATIFVSAFPTEEEKIIKNLDPKEFREFVKPKFKIKFLPEFKFVIDKGKEVRARIDELLK